MSDESGQCRDGTEQDVPEYVTRAEQVFAHWALSSPVDCMQASEDKPPEQKREIFESELQYHLGAYTAAESVCNSLYKIEGLDRYYPEHHPPWMEEAVEYQQQLEQLLQPATDREADE